MTIPQIAQDYIKESVSKEMSGKTTDLSHYVRSMVNCWDMDGFDSKKDAHFAYADFVRACKIRTWCRRNGYTTRKGSAHSFNGQTREDRPIWEIVKGGSMESEANGVKWTYRKIDQLRNVYVWF